MWPEATLTTCGRSLRTSDLGPVLSLRPGLGGDLTAAQVSFFTFNVTLKQSQVLSEHTGPRAGTFGFQVEKPVRGHGFHTALRLGKP